MRYTASSLPGRRRAGPTPRANQRRKTGTNISRWRAESPRPTSTSTRANAVAVIVRLRRAGGLLLTERENPRALTGTMAYQGHIPGMGQLSEMWPWYAIVPVSALG